MSQGKKQLSESCTSRREFLKTSAITAATVSGALSVVRSAHAAGSDALKNRPDRLRRSRGGGCGECLECRSGRNADGHGRCVSRPHAECA